jgi:BirA family biotin operon repressor/biotin-[acetyl-CoA-carboxylase] ligase
MSESRYTSLDRPPLSEQALTSALTGPNGSWRALAVVAETGSTNADVAARAAGGEAEGLVLVTDHQRAGRGRLSRTWSSPPRSSLAVSVLLRPQGVPAERLGWLPLLGGLAVVDALTSRCGLPARLKWPNDVLVTDEGEERKVCGILAEVVPGHGTAPDGQGLAVVLGAGINVTQTRAELPVPAATSLRLAGAATTDRDTVLRAYLRALAVRYRAFVAAAGDPRSSGIGSAYREACATLGRQVEIHLPSGSAERGLAQEVDDEGRLVVLVGEEPRPFAAGDVVHVRGQA